MKTMKDVAERAQVSATTVSFVLSGRQPTGGPISPETQQRVLEAAKELGYRRNALVQAVVSGHNRALGFLASNIEHEFVAKILGAAIDAAEAAGYAVQILRLKNNVVDQAAIERCFEMRLAGLLTIDMNPDALEYLNREMRPHRVPVAFIDTSFQRDWGTHIITDDIEGCRLAIDHLVTLGHNHIAFIGGEKERGMSVVREQGYRLAMQRHGLEIPAGYITHGHWGIETGEKVAGHLLDSPTPPTAMLCANDAIAIGAQRLARRRGLRLPDDLSVVGFANSELAQVADPALTSVAQPMEEIGRTAVKAVLEKLNRTQKTETWADAPVEIVLPTRLIVRHSTAPPSKAKFQPH